MDKSDIVVIIGMVLTLVTINYGSYKIGRNYQTKLDAPIIGMVDNLMSQISVFKNKLPDAMNKTCVDCQKIGYQECLNEDFNMKDRY